MFVITALHFQFLPITKTPDLIAKYDFSSLSLIITMHYSFRACLNIKHDTISYIIIHWTHDIGLNLILKTGAQNHIYDLILWLTVYFFCSS